MGGGWGATSSYPCWRGVHAARKRFVDITKKINITDLILVAIPILQSLRDSEDGIIYTMVGVPSHNGCKGRSLVRYTGRNI